MMFVDIGQESKIKLGQCPAERAVFRKLHGVAYGHFEVVAGLDKKFQQGVFQEGMRYPTWVRFSSDTLPTAPDLKSTCGVAMKLFGVEGEKLLGKGDTQDFILQNNAVFFVDNAEEMAAFTTAGVIDHNYQAYLDTHPKTNKILMEMAKDEASVLTADYWSCLPYKLGEEYVKYKLVPEGQELGGIADQNDYLAYDLERRLLAGEARFKFMVQLRTEPDKMPLDEATVEWPETKDNMIHVATLVLAKQDICARGQADYGQHLSFNPWHSLKAHEPVGSLSDARKVTYAASSQARHEANGVPDEEPREPRCPFAHMHAKKEKDDCIVKAAIYPPIGVARMGDSPDEYFIGPEVPEPIAQEKGYYRDTKGRLKRQAARFRVYGLNALGEPVRELTTENAEITWGLEMVNQKSAWYQFQLALDIPEAKMAPPSLLRNANVADRSKLVIKGGEVELTGANAKRKTCAGKFMDEPVYLGEGKTDEKGRLIVLGGHGLSKSYNGSLAVTFANNETWHDDTSDGPVTAKVIYDGAELEVEPAWVVVAPPDYAPMQKSVRTMWDLMRDVAIQADLLVCPQRPSFRKEIQPIFERMTNLQWVNAGFAQGFGWNGPFDFTSPEWMKKLSDSSVANMGIRRALYRQFRNYQFDGWSPVPWPNLYGDAMNVPPVKSPRENCQLSDTQLKLLECWAAGNFIDDYDPDYKPKLSIDEYPVEEQPDVLTRAAMEYCLADAFHPGCEMTWPMRHASMYSAPFRLKHIPDKNQPEAFYGEQLDSDSLSLAYSPLSGGLYAGGVTRWMAVPWQTDTASCRSGYSKDYDPYLPTFWPARVPNQIMSPRELEIIQSKDKTHQEKLDAFAYRPSWNTPLDLSKGYTHQINAMVKGFGQMGVVQQVEIGDVEGLPKLVQAADRNELIKYEDDQEKAMVGLRSHDSRVALEQHQEVDWTKIDKARRLTQ